MLRREFGWDPKPFVNHTSHHNAVQPETGFVIHQLLHLQRPLITLWYFPMGAPGPSCECDFCQDDGCPGCLASGHPGYLKPRWVPPAAGYNRMPPPNTKLCPHFLQPRVQFIVWLPSSRPSTQNG